MREDCKKREVNPGFESFYLVYFPIYCKRGEPNLIYTPAHVCLPTASGGSLISHNWRDGFFKSSLWCEGLTFVFWSNYIIGRPAMSGVKQAACLFNETANQNNADIVRGETLNFLLATGRLVCFEVFFIMFDFFSVLFIGRYNSLSYLNTNYFPMGTPHIFSLLPFIIFSCITWGEHLGY